MVSRVEPEPEPETDADADADAKAAARRILVVGALGGRFDHEMSNLSAMHEFAETRIVLLGRSSMATLVPPGVTDIVPDLDAEGLRGKAMRFRDIAGELAPAPIAADCTCRTQT